MANEKSAHSEESVSSELDALPDVNALPPNLIIDEKSQASRSFADLDIEAPEAEDATISLGSFAERIRARLNLPGTREDEPKPKRKRKRATKREQAELMDAARTLLSPFLCFVIAQNLGEACAPTDEEADTFVEGFARIIARHVPIPEHLSPDLLDLFSMSAVVIIWYRRVKDDLPRKGGDDDRQVPGPRDDGRGGRTVEDVLGFETVEQVKDATAVSDFLPRGEA